MLMGCLTVMPGAGHRAAPHFVAVQPLLRAFPVCLMRALPEESSLVAPATAAGRPVAQPTHAGQSRPSSTPDGASRRALMTWPCCIWPRTAHARRCSLQQVGGAQGCCALWARRRRARACTPCVCMGAGDTCMLGRRQAAASGRKNEQPGAMQRIEQRLHAVRIKCSRTAA